MSTAYLSQIEAFAFGFAPRGWMQCNGQILPINQNQALFALLGTTYGGNGVNTFALPDLRGRLAISMGQGQGLPPYQLGAITGTESVTLQASNNPSHTHSVNVSTATSGGSHTPASNEVLASSYTAQAGGDNPEPVQIYSSGNPLVPMGALSSVGGQGHSNIAPVLAINYCICVQGLFPSQN